MFRCVEYTNGIFQYNGWQIQTKEAYKSFSIYRFFMCSTQKSIFIIKTTSKYYIIRIIVEKSFICNGSFMRRQLLLKCHLTQLNPRWGDKLFSHQFIPFYIRHHRCNFHCCKISCIQGAHKTHTWSDGEKNVNNNKGIQKLANNLILFQFEYFNWNWTVFLCLTNECKYKVCITNYLWA